MTTESAIQQSPRRKQVVHLLEGAMTCCYAKSEKSWIADPQGVEWETFLTTGESTTYGTAAPVRSSQGKPYCEPTRAA